MRTFETYRNVLFEEEYEDIVHIAAQSGDEGNATEESENTYAQGFDGGGCWVICGWSSCHRDEP